MVSFLNKVKALFRRKKKPKVGYALGSGGFWGFSHIGFLKVLEKNDIFPDCIVGCSMGSIIGALYALNPDSLELEKTALNFKKWNLLKLADFNVVKCSLISGKKIRKLLEELIGDRSFSDTKIPLKIVATDLEKGEEVILNEGKIIDAVMASICIPGIFPPVKLGGKILVDGGVVNPTPTNVLFSSGCDVVLGVDLTMKHSEDLKNPLIFQTILRSYDIIRSNLTRSNISKNDNVLILKPDVLKLKSFKFYEIHNFISEGEKITEKFLDEIKVLVL